LACEDCEEENYITGVSYLNISVITGGQYIHETIGTGFAVELEVTLS